MMNDVFCDVRARVRGLVAGWALPVMLLAVAILAGCGQSDIFTLADEGVPVITALADNDDATATIMLRVTADGFYKREFSTPVVASSASILHVTEGNVILIADATTSIYVRDTGNNNSGWTTTNLGNIPAFIMSRGDQIYAVVTSPAYEVYSYNRGSATWSLYKTLSSPPVSVAVQGNRIIWNYSSAGQIYVYDLDTGAEALPTFNQGPGATTRPLFLLDDVIYTGYIATDVTRMYTAGVLTAYISLAGFIGYEFALSGGEVFAAVFDASTLAIYRMSGGTFVRDYGFASTASALMKLGTVDADVIAVGINGSTSDDGLYAYNHRNQSIRKLSSRSIQMMFVR